MKFHLLLFSICCICSCASLPQNTFIEKSWISPTVESEWGNGKFFIVYLQNNKMMYGFLFHKNEGGLVSYGFYKENENILSFNTENIFVLDDNLDVYSIEIDDQIFIFHKSEKDLISNITGSKLVFYQVEKSVEINKIIYSLNKAQR